MAAPLLSRTCLNLFVQLLRSTQLVRLTTPILILHKHVVITLGSAPTPMPDTTSRHLMSWISVETYEFDCTCAISLIRHLLRIRLSRRVGLMFPTLIFLCITLIIFFGDSESSIYVSYLGIHQWLAWISRWFFPNHGILIQAHPFHVYVEERLSMPGLAVKNAYSYLYFLRNSPVLINPMLYLNLKNVKSMYPLQVLHWSQGANK